MDYNPISKVSTASALKSDPYALDYNANTVTYEFDPAAGTVSGYSKCQYLRFNSVLLEVFPGDQFYVTIYVDMNRKNNQNYADVVELAGQEVLAAVLENRARKLPGKCLDEVVAMLERATPVE